MIPCEVSRTPATTLVSSGTAAAAVQLSRKAPCARASTCVGLWEHVEAVVEFDRLQLASVVNDDVI